MRVRTWAVVALAGLAGVSAAGPARAQENPNPEQMRKMYDDALQQLKAAQERKNQLAAENEKLGQQLESAKKDLAAVHGRLEELKRTDAEHAEKTFFLRSHYLAWQQFARMHPETAGRWRTFIEGDVLVNPRDPSSLFDREWPTGPLIPPSTRPAAETQPAATQPASTGPAATQPTAGPATTQATPATAPLPATTPASPATLPTQPAATQPAATRPA